MKTTNRYLVAACGVLLHLMLGKRSRLRRCHFRRKYENARGAERSLTPATKEITSFLGDGKFSISPEGFIDRLNEEFSNIPNCSSMKASYELDDSGTGLELQIRMALRLPVLEAFSPDSSSQLLFSYLGSENCFKNIVMYFENTDYAAATALATIQAIDPTLSFSDAKEIGAACVGANCQKWNYVRNLSFKWRILAERPN